MIIMIIMIIIIIMIIMIIIIIIVMNIIVKIIHQPCSGVVDGRLLAHYSSRVLVLLVGHVELLQHQNALLEFLSCLLEPLM